MRSHKRRHPSPTRTILPAPMFDNDDAPPLHRPSSKILAAVLPVRSALLRFIGRRRTVRGQILSQQCYPELRVLETTVVLQREWAGHAAGQFAFVNTPHHAGNCLYPIASAWDAEIRRIVFVTRASQDHRAALHEQLRAGDEIAITGPYGRFTFGGGRACQVWIAAGIGIAPFIARMEELARMARGHHHVDLFHSTPDISETAIARLTALAHAARVRLHLLVVPYSVNLISHDIRAGVPGWHDADMWFCGPAHSGRMLRNELVSNGFNSRHFHQVSYLF
jgi:predicted ferric reductase